jgi:hypothetical protein
MLGLVRSLSVLSVTLLSSMLKTIRNITMSPNGLEVLQNANVIEALVRVLTEHLDGPMSAVILDSTPSRWLLHC